MFGNRLRELRKERKLTMKELGKKFSLAESTISGYENGTRKPDSETINAFADFFEVSTDYLYGRTDKKNTHTADLSDEEREMLAFFNDPETGLFFREMKEAPEDQFEEMKQIWEVLKRRGLK